MPLPHKTLAEIADKYADIGVKRSELIGELEAVYRIANEDAARMIERRMTLRHGLDKHRDGEAVRTPLVETWE